MREALSLLSNLIPEAQCHNKRSSHADLADQIISLRTKETESQTVVARVYVRYSQAAFERVKMINLPANQRGQFSPKQWEQDPFQFKRDVARERKHWKSVKDQSVNVQATHIVPAHSLVVATSFSNISNKFYSSTRSGPNQTFYIFHGQFFQRKRLKRAQPFHKPNLKPTDSSWLILAPSRLHSFRLFCLPRPSWHCLLKAHWRRQRLLCTWMQHRHQVTCVCLGPGSPSTSTGTVQAQGRIA